MGRNEKLQKEVAHGDQGQCQIVKCVFQVEMDGISSVGKTIEEGLTEYVCWHVSEVAYQETLGRLGPFEMVGHLST